MTDTFEQRALSTPRGDVHYDVGGEGDAVVLLHGATLDAGLWAPQRAALAAGHRVLVPDLPGHGRSRPYAPFSLALCAEDVVAMLDRESIDRAHLVGQSMGGYVAQIVAHEHPDRVASIVAVDSLPVDGAYYGAVDRAGLAMTPWFLRMASERRLKRRIAERLAVTEPGRAYLRRVLSDLSKHEIVHLIGEAHRGLNGYADRRFRFACPVLIVCGERDAARLVAYGARWAAKEGHPVHVVPGAGHNSNMDQPEDFNAALLAFLDETGR